MFTIQEKKETKYTKRPLILISQQETPSPECKIHGIIWYHYVSFKNPHSKIQGFSSWHQLATFDYQRDPHSTICINLRNPIKSH